MLKRFSFVINIIFIISIISCKKFVDVNTNPNQPTKPPINGLLGGVTNATALNVFRAGNQVNNYVQYLASPNTASTSDIFDVVDASLLWTNLYGSMANIYDLREMGESGGSPHHQGIAKILMSINLKIIHDLWGDAPYTEALNFSTLQPKFDEAEANYQECIKLIDDGITLLQQPSSGVALDGSLDFIHGGDSAAWIKTAHLLKARLLNQLSKISNYNATAILNELNEAYTSNSDDAQITIFDVRNPWADIAVDNKALILGGWLSKYYVDVMNGNTFGILDPRLPLITNLTKFEDYRGTRNGAGRVGSGTANEESVLTTTGWYSSTNSPLIICSYSESKFIEAEVKFKNGLKPDAYAAYLEGITANMEKMGVSTASINIYLAYSSVAVGAANLSLQKIMVEKYKALFLNPETWNDARRIDYQYPGFQMPLNAVTTSFIRRLVYPDVETSRNSSNTPDISDVTQRLWWDIP